MSQHSSSDHLEVINLLPHRFPFLLIDRVVEVETGKRILAIKNVSISEPYFTGHFPGQPIMPGVLVLEAMAQAAALLAFYSVGEGDEVPRGTPVLLLGMDGVRFRRQITPGDQLQLEVTLLSVRHRIWKMKGVATVEGARAAEAELMATVRPG